MDFSNLNTGQWFVIGLSIFLLVWYVIAGYLNRQRGIRIYRWLRDGLESTGQLAEVHWIGSSGSGAQIKVTQVKEPFQFIEATILLETREVLPLWIFNMLRNKRDELILKASLRKKPSQEVEIAQTKDREFTKALAKETKRPYEQLSTPNRYLIAYRGKKDLTGKQQLLQFLEESGGAIVRVSLGSKKPHLLLRVHLSSLMENSAENFLSGLKTWVGDL